MSTRSDSDWPIRAWLAAEATDPAPQHLLDATRTRLKTTSQRGPWSRIWRVADMQVVGRTGSSPILQAVVTVAAVVILAVIATNLLTAWPTVPNATPSTSPTPQATPTSPPVVSVPTVDGQPGWDPGVVPMPAEFTIGRHSFATPSLMFTLDLPTEGWAPTDPGCSACLIDTSAIQKGGAPRTQAADAVLLQFGHVDGVYADPCGAQPGTRTTLAEVLASDVASLPGVDVLTPPTDVTVGGFPAQYVVIRVRDDIPCAAGAFRMWYDLPAENEDPRFATAAGQTNRIWILDMDGSHLWIEAETYEGADPDLAEEVQRIVESIRIWDQVFPQAGELAPGWYPSGGFGSFLVPTAGWISSGPGPELQGGSISKGTVGAADGATIRYLHPLRPYADPCGEVLGPPIGSDISDLTRAITEIPGLEVEWSPSFPLAYSSAQQMTLTPGPDAGCPPTQFHLWRDEFAGSRTFAAPNSTIRLWIFYPNDREIFGRWVIEAETYAGTSPQLDQEILEIVASYSHGG